jgi:putative flippase GtrA
LSITQPYGHIIKTGGRFLLSGGANTVLTYGLYLVLIRLLPYQISYTIAFVVGVALAYFLNRFFVFQSKGKFGTALLFPMIYGAQYFVNLLIIFYWVEILGYSELFAPVVACGIVVPLNFIGSRFLFTSKKVIEAEGLPK